MDTTAVITLMQESLITILTVSAPILGVAVGVGLIISILQATTSIQEQTLTFVPKIVAIVGVLIIFGGWMLNFLIEFTMNIFTYIPELAR